MQRIHDLDRLEITELCQTLGQPAFRARQLWDWLYVRRAQDWKAMLNLPKAMRERLAEGWTLHAATPVHTDRSSDGSRKILAALLDGERIEEVLIPAADRETLCVSAQVGCKFHCAFCASGLGGFVRNLNAGEIIGQVLLAAHVLGDRPGNLVYMGMGEPLDNYEAVLKSIRILNDPDGMAIGARRITISTCGVVPGIERLAEENLQVELSVSLHAPDDDLRARLMPVNRSWPIATLLETCRRYAERTGRIITFEYTLVHGVNDTPEHARRLAALLGRLPARANLLPLSPVPEFDGARPDRRAVEAFRAILEAAGINATVRDSRGSDQQAACGQLRRRMGFPEPK